MGKKVTPKRIKKVVEQEGLEPKTGYRISRTYIMLLLELFAKPRDARISASIDYPLGEILLAGFLAVLGGANNWVEMAAFCEAQREWLCKFCPSFRHLHRCRCDRSKPGRYTPSHDTFRDVFSKINMAEFQIAISGFLSADIYRIKNSSYHVSEGKRRLICMDGKEQRHTGRKHSSKEGEKVRNLQVFHLFDFTNKICLRSIPIHDKTNEIPVAQKILKVLDIRNCIITADALHTQVETVKIVIAQGADYVFGLKGNQQNMEDDAKELFTDKLLAKIRKAHGKDYWSNEEKAHNCIEKWRVHLFAVNGFPSYKERFANWEKLAYFVCIDKEIISLVDGTVTQERRYYITSLSDAATIAESIRNHWSVEAIHWDEDCCFEEDKNTTMSREAMINLSSLNLMVDTILKIVKELYGIKGLTTIRKQIGWNIEEGIITLASIFTEEVMQEGLKKASEDLTPKAVQELLDVMNAEYHVDDKALIG